MNIIRSLTSSQVLKLADEKTSKNKGNSSSTSKRETHPFSNSKEKTSGQNSFRADNTTTALQDDDTNLIYTRLQDETRQEMRTNPASVARVVDNIDETKMKDAVCFFDDENV